MPRFAANLDLLFTNLALPDRFAAARAAGFERVEMLDPYAMRIEELDRALTRNQLKLTLISTPLGDQAAGEHGFMGVPRRIADFRRGFEMAQRYANALDVEIIHLMAGVADKSRAEKMLARNLAWAAYNAPDQTLTLGPLSPKVTPGYAIESYDQTVDLIDWIGAPNLCLGFDTLHALDAIGDPLAAWATYGSRAGHIQLSDADDDAFVAAVCDSGFDGILSVARTAPPKV